MPDTIPPDQPAESFLAVKAVAERYAVCVATVWDWAKTAPGFPKPVRLSPGCTRWRLSDLQSWEQARTCPRPRRGGR